LPNNIVFRESPNVSSVIDLLILATYRTQNFETRIQGFIRDGNLTDLTFYVEPQDLVVPPNLDQAGLTSLLSKYFNLPPEHPNGVFEAYKTSSETLVTGRRIEVESKIYELGALIPPGSYGLVSPFTEEVKESRYAQFRQLPPGSTTINPNSLVVSLKTPQSAYYDRVTAFPKKV